MLSEFDVDHHNKADRTSREDLRIADVVDE